MISGGFCLKLLAKAKVETRISKWKRRLGKLKVRPSPSLGSNHVTRKAMIGRVDSSNREDTR